MLFAFLVVLFVIVSLLLCLVVLIQSDKGGGISGALGGGLSSANALLGTQDTANILTRATTIFATLYLVLCIVISLFVARIASQGDAKSLLKERAQNLEAPAAILEGGGIQLEEDEGGAEGQSAPTNEGSGLRFEEAEEGVGAQQAAPAEESAAPAGGGDAPAEIELQEQAPSQPTAPQGEAAEDE
jgi:preprotein translocase subunit SecG